MGDENKLVYTKQEIEQLICEAMGGRASEILYYGSIDGLSSGIGGDLENATNMAHQMVTVYGMHDDFGYYSTRESDFSKTTLYPEIKNAAEGIVKKQLEHALTILKENKNKLDALTDILIDKNRVDREEIIKLFNKQNLGIFMDIIINNPFRIIGKDISVTEKDLHSTISKAKLFIEMGREPERELDCPSLPKIPISLESIINASSKIERTENRLKFQMFWFWQNNAVDSTVLELLKTNNEEHAYESLKKVVEKSKLNQENFSTFHNYIVLNLIYGLSKNIKSYFKEALLYISSVLQEALYKEAFLKKFAPNLSFVWDSFKKDYIKKILRIIQSDSLADKPQMNEMLTWFEVFDVEILNYVKKLAAEPLLYSIEECIKKSSINRKKMLDSLTKDYKYQFIVCLLYTSDAADDTPCVDLGGRRIIKKKKTQSQDH
eukprot:TRINITY_DN16545_c0_g1_i4.p1 TRINITY_DN16545_c0_g1~~TRINITY_DN16545_c0_g1_i4.p1  ORF type:complete len:434 (+),score=66.23 TRINITY_DN16545_c0_g1_i4:203-1504(+)